MSIPSVLAAFGVRVVLGLAVVPWAAGVVLAQSAAPQAMAPIATSRIASLTQTMMMDEIFAIMREEGLEYGRTLATEMFPGDTGPQWNAVIDQIYDLSTMRTRFDAALAESFAGAETDLEAIESFFGSEQGQTILRLEIEARRALLDDEIEDAAQLAWQELSDEGSPRVDRITRFAEINDLIESNVMGALNANLAFYRGLSESGAFPQEMTEDQLLSDVWSQEQDVRTETQEWLFPFLSLAYQPLSDDELNAYIGFSETPAGQKLNTALFAAYDVVFSQISLDLGRAAAKQMQGEDI